MKNHLLALCYCLLASFALPAAGHEFWLTATAAKEGDRGSVACTMHVGENYDGQLVGWVQSFIESLRVYSKGNNEQLRGRLSEQALPGIELSLPKTGSHLIALDSVPSMIEMNADKFNSYLNEEGLDTIIKQREAANHGTKAARERFRRHVKALVQTGGKVDATYGVRTGQRLEIVPLTNPLTSMPGANLQFLVLFEGKPLAGALLKAWHKRGAQLLVIKARADGAGRLEVTLPWAGSWMTSVVHMVAAPDPGVADWDSLWANLTFELPGRPGKIR